VESSSPKSDVGDDSVMTALLKEKEKEEKVMAEMRQSGISGEWMIISHPSVR
jgi:hypothetical protein